MSFFECELVDDILFLSSFKRKGYSFFPLHSLQYFSLMLINAYLFVQK